MYVVGDTYARQGYATFETKAGPGSGGGYERWRSVEWRPHTSRTVKEDVYVPVHRLLAVVECYPDEMDVGDILAHMDGRDVHHTTGVKWANFGVSPNFDKPGIEVVDHGRHGSITREEMLTWAKEAKDRVERKAQQPLTGRDVCAGCGKDASSLWTAADFDGERCLDCAVDASDGATIQEA